MWRWAQWLDRATARVLGPVFALSEVCTGFTFWGDAAGTWSRLSPWCFVWIEPTGFSFSLLGEKPSPNPRDLSQPCWGRAHPQRAPVWYKRRQKPSKRDWQVGRLAVPSYAWTRILLA